MINILVPSWIGTWVRAGLLSLKIAKLLLTQPPRLVNCKYYWTKIIFKIYLFSRFNSVIFSFKQCKQNLRNRKKHKQKQIMSTVWTSQCYLDSQQNTLRKDKEYNVKLFETTVYLYALLIIIFWVLMNKYSTGYIGFLV